ncbi:MAG: hypothetical protein GXP63_03850 [DPANN group archaeon]|nr:hypothetical protein [DPANN group archaeon]
MTEDLFEAGHCKFCDSHTQSYCDECNNWCCETHRTRIRVNADTTIDLCEGCAKHAEPGAIIGGVTISKHMLPED